MEKYQSNKKIDYLKKKAKNSKGLNFFHKLTHPQFLDRLNYEFKGENNGKIRSLGMFFGLQHFQGRGAC
jgi:hypothetical protein